MPRKSRQSKYTGRGIDERYINDQYLRAIAEEYDDDPRFSSISLNEKTEVLELIRHLLSHKVYKESGRANGETEITKRLLDNFHANVDPDISLRIGTFSILALLLKMIQKNEKAVVFNFKERVPIPEDDTQPELKEAYLTLISEATVRIIEEVARVFGHVPSQQQANQESTSNELPLDESAAQNEQVESLKPVL